MLSSFFNQKDKDHHRVNVAVPFSMQEAQKYTILVEAKDHGEKVQLSSTSMVILNIMDKHGHPSEFTKKTVSEV